MNAKFDDGPSLRMPVGIGQCPALYCTGANTHSRLGALIDFRQATEDDAAALREFFHRLPVRSRYDRFLCACAEPPPFLTAQLNSQDHLVLVADIAGSASSRIVAEARIAVDPRDRTSCEAAIAVAGDWQDAGIGRTLFWALRARAISRRLRFVHADILSSNTRALSLARKLGCVLADHAEDGRLYRATLALP
jgi:GNAT superfamily N-acetyltransferase